MRLWTVTDQACWLAAKQRGFFVNDRSYVDPWIAKSYDWMHARFSERCKQNPDFCGTDSLVWCRQDFDRTMVRLKPVSATADEWILVFLETSPHSDTVRLRLEVLEDFCELTDPYHRLTLGPVKVHIVPTGETCSVNLHVQHNPTVVKLCMTGPADELFGEYVKVQLICTNSIWTSQEWSITNYNGSITACKKATFNQRWHRILIECNIPDEEVLLSSEQAFTLVMNNIGNDRHDFINWKAGPDETDWNKLAWDAPVEECVENYKGIFKLNELRSFSSGHPYDIQGVVEGIPMSAIRSVWHMYDGHEDDSDY